MGILPAHITLPSTQEFSSPYHPPRFLSSSLPCTHIILGKRKKTKPKWKVGKWLSDLARTGCLVDWPSTILEMRYNISEGATADDLSAERIDRLALMKDKQIEDTFCSLRNQMKKTFAALDKVMRAWSPDSWPTTISDMRFRIVQDATAAEQDTSMIDRMRELSDRQISRWAGPLQFELMQARGLLPAHNNDAQDETSDNAPRASKKSTLIKQQARVAAMLQKVQLQFCRYVVH